MAEGENETLSQVESLEERYAKLTKEYLELAHVPGQSVLAALKTNESLQEPDLVVVMPVPGNAMHTIYGGVDSFYSIGRDGIKAYYFFGETRDTVEYRMRKGDNLNSILEGLTGEGGKGVVVSEGPKSNTTPERWADGMATRAGEAMWVRAVDATRYDRPGTPVERGMRSHLARIWEKTDGGNIDRLLTTATAIKAQLRPQGGV